MPEIRRCGSCRCIRIMFGYATCPWITADNHHVTPNMKCRVPNSRFKRFKNSPEKLKEYLDKFHPLGPLRDSDACIYWDGSHPENCKLTGKRCTPRIPYPDKILASCLFTIKCPNFEGVKYCVKGRKFVPINPPQGMGV